MLVISEPSTIHRGVIFADLSTRNLVAGERQTVGAVGHIEAVG